MTTATTKPAVTQSKIVLDWDAAAKHLDTIEQKMIKEYAGKDGVNPYVWIQDNIKPLRTQLAINKTDELYGKIMTLQVTEPKVDLLATVVR